MHFGGGKHRLWSSIGHRLRLEFAELFKNSGFRVDGTNPKMLFEMGVHINHQTWGLSTLKPLYPFGQNRRSRLFLPSTVLQVHAC